MGSRTDEKRPVKRDCVVARCSVPQRISPAASLKEKLHSSTSGCVCRFGEAFDKSKKLVRLSDEQSIRRQGRHRVHGRAFGGRGTNDRADREVAAEEYRGFRHDHVSFEIFAGIVRQLRKRHWYAGDRIVNTHGRSIPGLVVPSLEVAGLGWSDAEQDAQNFNVGHPLRQLRIKTGPALLDKRKMKSGGVGQ